MRSFTAGSFAENGYLADCGDGGAVVVDPGAGAGEMLDVIEEEGLDVRAVLLTHAHLDHVEGVASVVEATGAPLYLHPEARDHYEALPDQAASFGVSLDSPPPPDRDLEHGERLELGACAFEVRHAPGHAPGHVLFWAEEAGLAFTGDLVFRGSIGRTDLPGGDFRTLMESIREQLLTLPDETTLYTGHGPATTVGEERTGNPFLIPHYGGELA